MTAQLDALHTRRVDRVIVHAISPQRFTERDRQLHDVTMAALGDPAAIRGAIFRIEHHDPNLPAGMADTALDLLGAALTRLELRRSA